MPAATRCGPTRYCFTCGRDLHERVAHIGHVKDDPVYGFFPALMR